jgi:hypothetical protein
MKKFVSVILSAIVLASAPVFAQEANEMEPMTDESLPEAIMPMEEVMPGLLQETNDEATMERRHYRRCPRGYRLVAYRQRIGPIVVVRYRCVRYGRW